jgi:hypothetical protein
MADTGKNVHETNILVSLIPIAIINSNSSDFLDEAPVTLPPEMSEPEILAAPSDPDFPAAEPVFAPESEPIVLAPEPEPVFAPAPETAAPVYEALAEAAEPESIRLEEVLCVQLQLFFSVLNPAN